MLPLSYKGAGERRRLIIFFIPQKVPPSSNYYLYPNYTDFPSNQNQLENQTEIKTSQRFYTLFLPQLFPHH